MGRTVTATPDLVQTLEAHGLALRVSGDALLVGPRDRLTPALIEQLKAEKPRLRDFGPGFFTAAAPVRCLDPECGFTVAVQWQDKNGRWHWSCPKCGLTSGHLPHQKG